MQNFVINPPPPLFRPPVNVEIGMMHRQLFAQFSTLNGVGVGERALGIKLTPVNVQVSQHLTRIVGLNCKITQRACA